MGTKHRGTVREQRALDAYIKLRRAANTLSSLESASLREAGLTESQFGVLEALLHLGPQRQTDLANKLLCSAGNLTTVVDNLERDGLVERRRDGADRRVVTVHLSADGRKLIGELFPRHAAAIVNWFAVLEPDEQHRLSDVLRRLGRQDTNTPAAAGFKEQDNDTR
jgi:MarR family 2-MHQ and catechol resistance regulon transcriptional repressor